MCVTLLNILQLRLRGVKKSFSIDEKNNGVEHQKIVGVLVHNTNTIW